jgi:hypothetical protein
MDAPVRKIALAAAVVNDLTARRAVHDNANDSVPVFSIGGLSTAHASESPSI